MEKEQLDRWIFFTVLGLMAFGMIMVYSASAVYAEKIKHNHFYYLERQMLWVFLGIVAMMVSYKFPYEKLRNWSPLFVWGSVALLVYVLIRHSGRWIPLGFVHIQVSDLARLALIFFFAHSLSRREAEDLSELKSFTYGFLPHAIYLVLLGGLIVAQPDFSSAAMLVLIGLSMLFLSPVPVRYFALSAAVLVPVGMTIVKFSSYKMDRWTAFLHPEQDMLGKGYQIIQSLISLGSGGITGVGFARSTQKLFFLPEAHTDFIFSIIGEEWGLLGTLFILVMFLILLWRGIYLAHRASDRFTGYLAFGLTANLVFYGLINMMVAVKLAPPTGLPMPFVSYGGSSLIISSISAGLLLNISRRVNSPVRRRHTQFATRARQNWQQRKLQFMA